MGASAYRHNTRSGMMSELAMNRETNGVPYDRAQELTGWVIVDSVPIAADGERFPARSYGSGGYLATDALSHFTGLVGVSVHAVIAPDYGAMVGQGRRALMYRGHGGPTASEYWAWGVELERVGDLMEVYGVHQDQLGAFQSQLIGTFGVGVEWVVLAVSRETIGGSLEWRAWIDGKAIGVAVQVSTVSATPGQPVTLGARVIAAGTTERQWLGRIERVLVNESAATDAQIRYEYAALVGAYADAYDTVSAYLPPAFDTDPGSVYGRYRVRPMAELQAIYDAQAQRYDDALVPPSCYGAHLVAFESALGVTPNATQSIAERQASALAALSGVQGLGPPALQELAAQLFGVPTGDVEIIQGANYFDFDLTGTGELSGPPWRIRGPVNVTSEVAGMEIHVPAGRDLRYAPGVERAIFVQLAVNHRPIAGPTSREEDHGLALMVDSATGLSTDTWYGFHLMTQAGNVRWIAHDGTGFATRTWSLAGLSSWVPLSTPVSWPQEIVLEWVSDSGILGGSWYLRHRVPGSGPGGWTTAVIPADSPERRAWIGFGVASSVGAAVGDVDVVITQAIFKAGDSPAAFYWQAFDTDPTYRDLIGHTATLDAKGRASSYGSATHERYLLTDTDGAACNATPTVVTSARLPHIGSDSAQAAQMTGIFPTHLWTLQDVAGPAIDRMALADLADTGTAPTFLADGPRGQYAVEFAANANDLQAASDTTLDVTTDDAVIVAAILRVGAGSGVILGKERTNTEGWVLTRDVGALTLRVGDGIGSASATLSDATSGFIVDQWFAVACLVEDTGGGNARVVVATSQGSATGTGATGTSNIGLFALGASQSGNAVAHRQRWISARLGGEANGRTPSEIAALAARLAAATGVA
jgi:hypothetical protein